MPDPPANAKSAHAVPLGSRVPFELDAPCSNVEHALLCGERAGYIEVAPYGEGFRYKQCCANGHYARHVLRTEVELRLGISAMRPFRSDRMELEPSRRVALNVLVRDRFTCVHCARRAGELELDGAPVIVAPAHIIATHHIDAAGLRLDRELLSFARDVQLVCSCRAHSAARGSALMPLEDARNVFERHVLKGETRGANLGMTSLLDRLHRIAQKTVLERARRGLRQ